MPLAFQRSRLQRIAELPAAQPRWNSPPGALAYIVFTSGSTGIPKGVCVERGSLDAFTAAIRPVLGCRVGFESPKARDCPSTAPSNRSLPL